MSKERTHRHGVGRGLQQKPPEEIFAVGDRAFRGKVLFEIVALAKPRSRKASIQRVNEKGEPEGLIISSVPFENLTRFSE